MTKLTTVFAVVLMSTVLVGGYVSAHDGFLSVKTDADANADISISRDQKNNDNKDDDRKREINSRKEMFRNLKHRIETGLRLGTVTEVNADGSFKVENKKGNKESTINTSASTTYTKDDQPADKNAVVVGAMVGVKGAWDKATSTITSSVVNVFDKLRGIHVKGTITAISGTSLTVKADTGTVYTVDASKARVFHTFLFGASANVSVGDTVAVWGTHIEGSNTITARWIRVPATKPDPSPSPTAVQ